MDDLLLISLVCLAFLTLGIFLGRVIAGNKQQALLGKNQERNEQLNLQLTSLKDQLTSQSKAHQKDIDQLQEHFQRQLEKLESQREEIRREKEFLSNELTRKNAEFEHLQLKNREQKEEVEKLQEKFSKEFENLANRILEQKSEKFTSLNKENIRNLLHPLQERIKTFEEKVEKNNTDFIDRDAQLRKQLELLNEQNLKISQEALNLTRALKGDTKMQGNWGEMVLERVLERSGLQKDSEFFLQQHFTDDQGRRQLPDVVIHLPGDKRMIIDAKVSLTAYERYVNETDEQQRQQYLKQHLISVKRRVGELSAKNYHQIYQMESPDFVLLFIPIESAFALASERHPGLYAEAFDQNIILVTPTTLLAVLKTIDSMWQNEKQKANAIEIATRAGALYDSFTNFTDELLKLGKQLGTVQTTYEGAMKKLTGKGNLVGRVEKLRLLGARASKQLDTGLVKNAEENNNDSLKSLN